MISTTQINSAPQAYLSNTKPQQKELSLFERLPLDVHRIIFSELPKKDLRQISLTSKKMKTAIDSDEFNAIEEFISFLAKSLDGEKKKKILAIYEKLNAYKHTDALGLKKYLLDINIRKELIEELKTLSTELAHDLQIKLAQNGIRFPHLFKHIFALASLNKDSESALETIVEVLLDQNKIDQAIAFAALTISDDKKSPIRLKISEFLSRKGEKGKPIEIDLLNIDEKIEALEAVIKELYHLSKIIFSA